MAIQVQPLAIQVYSSSRVRVWSSNQAPPRENPLGRLIFLYSRFQGRGPSEAASHFKQLVDSSNSAVQDDDDDDDEHPPLINETESECSESDSKSYSDPECKWNDIFVEMSLIVGYRDLRRTRHKHETA